MNSFKTLFEQKNPKEAAIFVGRMQPFHIGHQKTIDIALKKYGKVAVIIVAGKGTSKDKTKNPFSFNERKKFIRRVYPNASQVKILRSDSAFLGDEKTPGLIGITKKAGWEPVAMYAGEDRIPSYQAMAKRANLDDFKVEQAARVTSATKVRNAIKDEDEKTFKKLVPKELHSMFSMMKTKLK